MKIIKVAIMGLCIIIFGLLCLNKYDKSRILNSEFLSQIEGFVSHTKEYCPFCGNTFTVNISELEKDLYKIRFEAKPPDNTECFLAFIEMDSILVFIYSPIELEKLVHTSLVDQYFPQKYQEYFARGEYDHCYAEEIFFDKKNNLFFAREYKNYINNLDN